MNIDTQRINLEEIIVEGKMCRDFEHGFKIENCNAYKLDICPLTCTYSKEMLFKNSYEIEDLK